MKFQHLILPGLLWLFVGIGWTYFPPSSPMIIISMVFFLSLAVYFSIRVVSRSHLATIGAVATFLFLLSSAFTGFSLINLLLILAIATIISQLTTSHPSAGSG